MTEITVTADDVRELFESRAMEPTLYVDRDDNSIQIDTGVLGCFFDSYVAIVTQGDITEGHNLDGTPDESSDSDCDSLAEWINTQVIPDVDFSTNE